MIADPGGRPLLVVVATDDDDSVCSAHGGTCTPSTPCDVACSGEQHDDGAGVLCDLCVRVLREQAS